MKKGPFLTKCYNVRHLGFSLVEALLAISLLALFATFLIGSFIYAEESTALSGARMRGAHLADEALEALRNIRDNSFSNLTAGTYGLAISGAQWSLSGSSDTTDIFTRSLQVATIDSRRSSASATINWQQNAQRTGTILAESRLTDWRRSFANWANSSVQSTLDLTGAADANAVSIYRNGASVYLVIVRVSGSNEELSVIDVTDPSIPSHVGSLELGASANDIAVCGNYAAIASASNSEELQVIELTNPLSPTLIGTLDLAGNANARSVACIGNVVFLGRDASTEAEVYAISLSTPSSPSLLSTLELGADAQNIALAQNNQYLYIASPNNSAELFIVAVSTPLSITLEGSFDATGVSDATAVAAFSTYASLGRANGTIVIVNAATVSSPTLTDDSLDIGTSVNDIAMGVGDIYFFIASNTAGTPTSVIDVSDPANPSILSSVSLSLDTKGIVWDYDLNRAFVAGTATAAELSVIRPN